MAPPRSRDQHFDGFDAEPEEISRRARKREAQAIRRLAEELGDLGEQSFAKLKFSDEAIAEALEEARAMRPRSDERRRQLQYVAKLLRQSDADDLSAQLRREGGSARTDPKVLRLEQLREALLTAGMAGVNELCGRFPSLERSKLRQLVLKARGETDPAAEHPHGRALYRYLRESFAGEEIPVLGAPEPQAPEA